MKNIKGDCIIFKGQLDKDGYGTLSIGPSNQKAHRMAWRLFKGPLKQDDTIDHLCRNKACINVEHMEPVSAAVNTMRGLALGVFNSKKTICKRGHPFTVENTRLFTDKRGKVGRNCRKCDALRRRRYYQKIAARKISFCVMDKGILVPISVRGTEGEVQI